jgi:hypothetical protein
VRVDVAFTPGEAIEAPAGVVVDVLRATSTIAQALDAGCPRVLSCLEIDDARAVRDELGEGLDDERDADDPDRRRAVRRDAPREPAEPRSARCRAA